MKDLSRTEKIKVAKAYISNFPLNVQAELHRLVSWKKIDRSIKNTLNNGIER